MIESLKTQHPRPIAGVPVISALDCYACGLPIKSSILPLLKHASGEKQLAAMLAMKRSVGVTPEMALKPRGDITRNPKQDISGSMKGHVTCPPKIKKKRLVIP